MRAWRAEITSPRRPGGAIPATSPLRRQLRAVGALALCLGFFATGAPGLSRAKPAAWEEGTLQERIENSVPSWLAPPALAGAWAGVQLRLATERLLGPVQQVFRVRQNWHLYGGGPRRIYRLEVWVDDALQYRSADPDHRWATAQLDHRRFRPIVERVVERAGASNFEVICLLVRRQWEADHGQPPGEVVMWATRQTRDLAPQSIAHGARCAAPDYALVHLDSAGRPVTK